MRAGVDFEGFCAWLHFKLHGKKADGLEGRILLLVLHEDEVVERVTINLEKSRTGLLFDSSGDPKLPKLVIHGALEDLIAFFRAPSKESAGKLQLFGDARLMRTLSDLLIQKKSLLDIRAGG